MLKVFTISYMTDLVANDLKNNKKRGSISFNLFHQSSKMHLLNPTEKWSPIELDPKK